MSDCKGLNFNVGNWGYWQIGGMSEPTNAYHRGEALGRVALHNPCLMVCVSLYNHLPLSVSSICDLLLTKRT